jgi:Tfp pilus assembly protein PilP
MAASKNESNMGKMVAAGAGVVALSAAAYLLFGPEGKKHRKDLKSWMVKMKAEVMEKMEEAQELTAPVYEAIVNEVSEKYKMLGNIDPAELAKEADTLKKHLKMLQREAKAKIMEKLEKKAAPKAKAKVAAVKKVVAKKARA